MTTLVTGAGGFVGGHVVRRLVESGVGRVDVLTRDTYAEPEFFFSFRRATHRGEPTYGRLLSLIGRGS